MRLRKLANPNPALVYLKEPLRYRAWRASVTTTNLPQSGYIRLYNLFRIKSYEPDPPLLKVRPLHMRVAQHIRMHFGYLHLLFCRDLRAPAARLA